MGSYFTIGEFALWMALCIEGFILWALEAWKEVARG